MDLDWKPVSLTENGKQLKKTLDTRGLNPIQGGQGSEHCGFQGGCTAGCMSSCTTKVVHGSNAT